jgi:hypothetical protein
MRRIGPRCLALAAALDLTACAQRTRDIAPAAVDPAMFAGATCSELVHERARRSQQLIFAGLAQEGVADDDRTRTMGAPTPTGTLFEGDRAEEIARLKGELYAASGQMKAMNCGPDYQ